MLLFERSFSYVEAAMGANTQFRILIGWQVDNTIELKASAALPFLTALTYEMHN
jgi:hypothetical protein